MSNHKNIVFFFTDDQRFDTISALGNPVVNTPNLDELVRNGTTFTQAHIPGGSVAAICMPSRAMLHTSKPLFHLEKDGSSIPGDHILLGEALQQAGYRTFGTGKWHNGHESYARSFTAGDEIFFGGMNDHWNVPANHYDPTGQYRQTHKVIHSPMQSNQVTNYISDHVHSGKHSSELFCEAAIEWLERDQSADPFFMYISFMAPHDPRSMPEPFQSMYNPEDMTLPANFQPQHFEYGVSDIRDELLAPYPRTPEEIKRHIAEYYGMISHLDHELGKVIQALKDSGKYENTIIVFAGDNGLAVGQHGLLGKQSLYEHSVRVPLIFAGPGIPKNEQRDTFAYLLDIYPTLCELNGITPPASVEGRSLVPTFADAKLKVRDELYLAYAELVRGVKNDRFKLIVYRNKEMKEQQLFDLQADPNELHNLIEQPQYAEVAAELTQKLKAYSQQSGELEHPSCRQFWQYG